MRALFLRLWRGIYMNGRGFRLRFVLAAALAAAGLAVPAASAGVLGAVLPPCGAVTYPFDAWGDYEGYCAFPNLGFENGTTSWTLSGRTSVASANEPWHVSGAGTHALQLGPGATALSSSLPVSLRDPWIRFFARSAGANGSLRVQVIFHGLLGNLTGVLNIGSLSPSGYSTWQPTQRVLSALALPIGTTSAQVQFTSTATSGSWQLDDVYLDPCASKLG
jgi:hypothetical protein